jgi:hypothetical protein
MHFDARRIGSQYLVNQRPGQRRALALANAAARFGLVR